MLLAIPAAARSETPGQNQSQGQTQDQTKNPQGSGREAKKNLVVKEWNTGAKGARTLDHTTTYNADGRKIEEIEYDSYGKQKWRKRFEWGENGRQARELVYDERNRLVNYKKFDYNELGKKKAQYTYDAKGRLLTTKIYEYSTQTE